MFIDNWGPFTARQLPAAHDLGTPSKGMRVFRMIDRRPRVGLKRGGDKGLVGVNRRAGDDAGHELG